MISPSFYKVLRDLWLNLPRTILVVLAIAIGIFGVGIVIDTYSLLTREVDTNYQQTNPASATLWMDKVDDAALSTARSFPGISDADKAHPPIRARVQVGPNQWDILLLYMVDDFNSMHIDKFFTQTGSWPPGDNQILIERASMPIINAEVGKPITMRILNSDVHEVQVSGTVFDPSPDPAWVNNIASGYITPNTLKLLGGIPPENGLRIVVGRNIRDRTYIRDVANNLGALLKQKGYMVKRVEVPIPGKYQQTDKSDSILFTLVWFGLLCLILSGLITAVLINSLLSQQIRQIGVMKALGASTHQIVGLYLGMVLCMSIIALVIGIPLGASVSKLFAFSTLDMLNFNVLNSSIPLLAYIIQIALGFLIPLLTALFPIFRGSRVTVSEAIRDYGVRLINKKSSHFKSKFERVSKIPRLLALSLRNSFRRRGRLVLSLIMLSIGGASFISSLGAASSWNKSIDKSFSNINYDIDVRFGQQYPATEIEKSIGSLMGVKVVEAWGYNMSTAFPKFSDGTYGPSYAVFAPRKESSLINPPVVEGRWLRGDDTNAIVLDTEFIDNAQKQGTPVRVGDDLILNLAGKDIVWHVVGIMDKIGMQSAAYTSYDYFSQITNEKGKAMSARVLIEGHDKTLQESLIQAIEQKLSKDKINIFVIQPLTATRQVMVNHVVLILFFLMAMSIMVAIIGALGLASTMSINVMERTREIGIMRSIGATSKIILQAIVMEGLIIGIFSWVIGTIVSIPLTSIISSTTGQFIFPRIMVFDYPLWAPALWLAIIIVVSAAASFYPAWRATRLTVRKVLAYE